MSAYEDLKPKQKQFVDQFLVDLNATQAAIRAGYSEATAEQGGAQLYRNIKIRAAIDEAMRERRERIGISADFVLQRLYDITRMKASDILDDDGNIRPISEWPEVWDESLSGMELQEVKEKGNDDREEYIETFLKKIKTPDKLRAIELMGKHIDINAWTERKVVEFGEGGLVINRPNDA